jgi:hypothetical protein
MRPVPTTITFSEWAQAGKTVKGAGTLTLAPDPPPPLAGVNEGGWVAMSAAVPGLGCARVYCTPAQGIPPSWPGTPAPPTVALAVSLNPANLPIGDIIGGVHDAAFTAYFAGAQPGSLTTVGAEWEAGRFSYTPAQITGMHAHLAELFAAAAPAGALYGQCFTAYTAQAASGHYPLSQWIAPGLGFYGFDGYGTSVPDVFGPALTQLESVVSDPVIAILETNSPVEADRPAWFADAYAWAADLDALAFIPFWGAAPYAWVPSDAATIAALSGIVAESQAG